MPRRLRPDARAGAVPSTVADPPTRVMERPPAEVVAPGPPLLMLAVRCAAADGTGPDGAARLAAVLVYLELKFTILAGQGNLDLIDAAGEELAAGRCSRCGIPHAEHPDLAPDPDGEGTHQWWWVPPGRRTVIGRYRRESAALLRGTALPWALPGTSPAAVQDMYQAAADTMTGPAGWYERPPPEGMIGTPGWDP